MAIDSAPTVAPPGEIERVRTSRLLHRMEAFAGFAAVLLAWQLAAVMLALPQILFPSPVQVAQALANLAEVGILYEYVLLSLRRYLEGVAAGSVIGIGLGLLIASNRRASTVLMPLVNFSYAIVEVAWIPLFVLWWGYGPLTIIVAVAYVVASPLVQNTIAGVRAVPPIYSRAVRSLGGKTWTVIWEVTLPAILPSIFNGLRVGAGFGFRALIFAEMIAQSEGIGYLIFSSAASQQTDRTMAGMIVMGLMWLILDRIYLRPLERISVQRWGLVTEAEGS